MIVFAKKNERWLLHSKGYAFEVGGPNPNMGCPKVRLQEIRPNVGLVRLCNLLCDRIMLHVVRSSH